MIRVVGGIAVVVALVSLVARPFAGSMVLLSSALIAVVAAIARDAFRPDPPEGDP